MSGWVKSGWLVAIIHLYNIRIHPRRMQTGFILVGQLVLNCRNGFPLINLIKSNSIRPSEPA